MIVKSDSKRKGFTLIELLIVIIVIGILSAMMMMSGTQSVASARAATIVSNMAIVRTAALAYYLGDMERSTAPSLGELRKYITGELGGSGSDADSYEVVSQCSAWLVKCTVKPLTSEVGRKLAGRAEKYGLYSSVSTASAGGVVNGTLYGGGGNEIFMFIRYLSSD